MKGGFFKRKSPEDGTSASHLELGFLQSGTRHFGRNVFKFQFRPMIGSPHSRCMTCRPKGMGLEVAMYTYRRGSTKGRVEASKSYLYRGGTYTLSRHSFYPLYFYTFSPTFHPIHIHTKVYSSRE